MLGSASTHILLLLPPYRSFYTALCECFCGGVWNSDKFPHIKENPCRASIAEIYLGLESCPECSETEEQASLRLPPLRGALLGEVRMEDQGGRWSFYINVNILSPERKPLCTWLGLYSYWPLLPHIGFPSWSPMWGPAFCPLITYITSVHRRISTFGLVPLRPAGVSTELIGLVAAGETYTTNWHHDPKQVEAWQRTESQSTDSRSTTCLRFLSL